jgi:tetratricopeptide (TPR) repeat protein
LLARGELADAIGVLQSVVAPPYAAKLPLRTYEVAAKALIAEALLQQGRITEAIASAQDANDQIVASSSRRYYPLLEAEAALRLGQAQRLGGDPLAARPNLERALRLRETSHDAHSPWIAEAQAALAACLLDLGERRAALALATNAQAIVAAHDTLAPHLRAPVSDVAARLSAR